MDDYVAGILAGNRTILARAITLIESQTTAHEDEAQDILQRIAAAAPAKPGASASRGAPGVGKSTFIEALGCYLD